MLSKINRHFFPDKEEINQVFIYLNGEINKETCGDAIAQIIEENLCLTEEMEIEGNMLEIEQEKPDVINLMLTSGGGDMNAALALMDIIEGSTIPVRTIAIGECASAALCLLMCGHQRVVTPRTSILSHQFSSGLDGNYANMEATFQEFKSYMKKMEDIYIEYTGLPRSTVKRKLLNSLDVYLTPQEALKYNIIDLVEKLN